jgi:hypothetical protein
MQKMLHNQTFSGTLIQPSWILNSTPDTKKWHTAKQVSYRCALIVWIALYRIILVTFISMPFLTFHPHYKWRGTEILLHWIKTEDTKLIICIISLCFIFNIWCHFRSSRK